MNDISTTSLQTARSDPERDFMVEAVDDRNRPLMSLNWKEIHRQGLFHRRCIVQVFAPEGKTYLIRRSPGTSSFPGRWDFPVNCHVPAGCSLEDTARQVLETMPALEIQTMHLVRIIPAAPLAGQEFLAILQARAKRRSSSELVALDRTETQKLATDFPDQMTPQLVFLWRSGLMADMWPVPESIS